MRNLILISALLLPNAQFACTVFCISEGGRVFAGNNEDYFDPATRMWFVTGGPGKHGAVYFGFANQFAQGGMNDAGLFFDGLALDREEAKSPSDKPTYAGNLAEQALKECSTVAEVIALFDRFNHNFLDHAQLIFGDRTGDGAIIERNTVVRKSGRLQIATNFRQSSVAPAAATCERYRISSRMLAEGPVSADLCRRALAATHQEHPASTLYSNVYDLVNGTISLYHFHDFDQVVVIRLADELAKGDHLVAIASLFPQSFAFKTFADRMEMAAAADREKVADKKVDPRTFTDFAGRYRCMSGPLPGVEFTVMKKDDKLFLDVPGRVQGELTPRGGAQFACITTSFRGELAFIRDQAGTVTGATARIGGLEISARKLSPAPAPDPAGGARKY